MSGVPDTNRCMGPRLMTENPFFQIFDDRCQAEAAYNTPAGPRCAACAEYEMETIRKGSCLLVIMAEQKGISIETLLSKYVRIERT